MREALTGLGLDEAYTYSLVAEDWILPIEAGAVAPPIRVDHASRKKEIALRTSLAPSLLAARAYNQAHGTATAELFEIAHVYLPRDSQILPDEPARLAMVAGRDFFGLKGVVEALLDRLHVRGVLEARPASGPLFQAGRAAELWLGETWLGSLGEIAPESLAVFDLREACAAAELNLAVLVEGSDLVPHHRPLADVPAVARDLSLVVPIALDLG